VTTFIAPPPSAVTADAWFNVEMFGAVGDGVTDDTAAIQAAINAALAVRGTVFFPPPSVTYKVTATLTIGTTGQSYCNLQGSPKDESNKLILWAGANTTPIFSTRGWRESWADSITIKIPAASSGVVAWDVDTNASATSSTHLAFRNCNVFIVSGGAGTACYGWQLGASALTNDISCISWYDCNVYGAGDNTKLHIGWSIEQANAISFHWYGGIGFYLAPMVKMFRGDDFNFHGLGGTHNAKDFRIDTNSCNVNIFAGRFELGDKFIDVEHDTGNPQNITVVGAKVYNYTPAGGQIIRQLGVVNLLLDNCQFVNRGGADYTANMLWHYCDGAGTGVTRVRGGVIQAPYPFHFINAGSVAGFRIRCESVTRCDTNGVYSSVMGADQSNALTYGATVNTDANLSDYFTLSVTNGTAFTIANPTNAFAGQVLTYDIKNSSGGAHGVITWGAAFLNGGAGTVGTGAFAGIANGKRRAIKFVYDGTNWIEQARTADI
jgi:pectate lyase-like protein